MAERPLAELLLLRKEFNGKVEALGHIPHELLRARIQQRVDLTNTTLSDVTAQVPRITINQVTQALDFYSRRLRLVDAAIQRANWETTVVVDDSVLESFEPEPIPAGRHEVAE